MKNHYKLFLRYCLAMIIMVIMGEVINYYFQKKVSEHTLSWFIAAFVWVILGGLILTFVDGRTRKKKSIKQFAPIKMTHISDNEATDLPADRLGSFYAQLAWGIGR